MASLWSAAMWAAATARVGEIEHPAQSNYVQAAFHQVGVHAAAEPPVYFKQ